MCARGKRWLKGSRIAFQRGQPSEWGEEKQERQAKDAALGACTSERQWILAGVTAALVPGSGADKGGPGSARVTLGWGHVGGSAGRGVGLSFSSLGR